jgi:hypothetical protein
VGSAGIAKGKKPAVQRNSRIATPNHEYKHVGARKGTKFVTREASRSIGVGMRIAGIRRRLADQTGCDHKRGKGDGDKNVMHGKLHSVDFSTAMSIGLRGKLSA